MRGPYQILLPLLGLFLVRVDLTDLFPLHLKVKVINIYDGDTVQVSHGSLKYKVRFSKIDSPEKRQPFANGKGDAGLESKKCLMSILKDGEHILRINKTDIYGRILGDLDHLSYDLIEQGCTSLYPFAEFSSQHEKFRFLRALKQAKMQKRGLWEAGGFRQPKLWRKSSKRIAGRPSRR